MPRLTGLYCYPVKSCRGIALTEATLNARGIEHDRAWLIVDANGRQRTQRLTPKLAHIKTALEPGELILRAPGMDELRVPWQAGGETRRVRHVTVWSDVIAADDVGGTAAAWLTDFLGEPSQLVTMGVQSRRVRGPGRLRDVHPDALARPVELAFSDGYPLLVLSEESLADLNRRLDLPGELAMDRFRPNLVVAGCEKPYAEDDWKVFRVGGLRFFAGGPCDRCVVTTTDQHTLARGPEPLRTLATYRRLPEGGVVFGQNAILAQPEGVLRVGYEVVVE